MKKTLSLILCLAMVLTIIPTGAVFAEESVNYISVPLTISESDCNFQSMVGFGESVTGSWCCLSCTNNRDYYLLDINDVKNNLSLTWKNAWTDGTVSNTAVFGGIDYQMIVKSAANGSAGFRLGGKDSKTLDVENGYYTAVKLLASDFWGKGCYGGSAKKMAVILNYTDGTQELKETDIVGDPFIESENAIAFKTIKFNGSLWNNSKVTAANSNGDKTGYMHVVEAAVNTEKTLDSVTLFGNNMTATDNSDGTVTLAQSDSANAYASANIFAVTAVTTQELQKKEYLSEVKAIVSIIGEDTVLTYSDENIALISSLNSAIEKCENNDVTIDSDTQAKIDKILANWNNVKPISETIDITNPTKSISTYNNSATNALTKRAFAAVGDSVLIYYNYLYSNSQINIMDMSDIRDTSKFAWKDTQWTSPKNVLNHNGIDYIMNIGSAAKGEGGALDFSSWNYVQYDITKNYYGKISILANAANTNNKPIGVILSYDDGTTDYKKTANVIWGVHGNSSDSKSLTVSGVYIDTKDYVNTPGTAVKAEYSHNISVYEVEADSAKALTSVTLLGAGVAAVKDDNEKYVPNSDATFPHASANVFALTAVTTKALQTETYNSKINALLTSLGDPSELTYTEENSNKIYALKALLNECAEKGITFENSIQVNAMLTAWAHCQGDFTIVSPEEASKTVEGSIINSSVTAVNRKSQDTVNGLAITALYDAGTNKLLNVKTENKSFAYNESVTISAQFDTSAYENVTDFAVKCFVWDSLLTLKPYMNCVNVK